MKIKNQFAIIVGGSFIRIYGWLLGYSFRTAQSEDEIMTANNFRDKIYSIVGYSHDMSTHHDKYKNSSTIFYGIYGMLHIHPKVVDTFFE